MAIARRTQTYDHAFGEVGEIRMVPEGLAPVNVRQVHFNEGQGDAREGIAQGHAGVRESPGIDDDEGGAVGAGRVHAVNQRTFMVALKRGERGAAPGGMLGQAAVNLRQGGGPVNLMFAGAQQVEVGTVEDKNLHVLLANPYTDTATVREVKPRKSK